MKGFFERQWELFLADMQEVGEFFLDAFGANEQLMLGAPKADRVEGEEGFFMTLMELRDADIDMFSTVFIGNAQTKMIAGRMVTPRGYKDV